MSSAQERSDKEKSESSLRMGEVGELASAGLPERASSEENQLSDEALSQ